MAPSPPSARYVSSDGDGDDDDYVLNVRPNHWCFRPRLLPRAGRNAPEIVSTTRTISNHDNSHIKINMPDNRPVLTTVVPGEAHNDNVLHLSSDSNLSSDSYVSSHSNVSRHSNVAEFDLLSITSSSQYMDSNFSDSSVSLDYKAKRINTMCDKILSSDNGYLPDSSHSQITKATILDTNLSLPARFKFCVQCRNENTNPFFQYCSKCFRFRMEYFEIKPTLKRKRIRHSSEENIHKDSPESSFGLSSDFLSQKENLNSKDTEANKVKIKGNSKLCNICLIKPKNGVINHGKIGHVYSCYPCAKLLWKKSNRCPLCNVKIKFVTKMIIG